LREGGSEGEDEEEEEEETQSVNTTNSSNYSFPPSGVMNVPQTRLTIGYGSCQARGVPGIVVRSRFPPKLLTNAEG